MTTPEELAEQVATLAAENKRLQKAIKWHKFSTLYDKRKVTPQDEALWNKCF